MVASAEKPGHPFLLLKRGDKGSTIEIVGGKQGFQELNLNTGKGVAQGVSYRKINSTLKCRPCHSTSSICNLPG